MTPIELSSTSELASEITQGVSLFLSEQDSVIFVFKLRKSLSRQIMWHMLRFKTEK